MFSAVTGAISSILSAASENSAKRTRDELIAALPRVWRKTSIPEITKAVTK